MKKQVTAYGQSANDTSSIANITSLNCSDTFIAKPYTISTISIVSMMGNTSIEFQHKFRPTDKQLGVILVVIFSLLAILFIFVILLLYRKRQLAKLDKLLSDPSHNWYRFRCRLTDEERFSQWTSIPRWGPYWGCKWCLTRALFQTAEAVQASRGIVMLN